MRKIKYEEHLATLGLCECLIPIIRFEVSRGNKITGYDTNGKWPQKNSHMIYLRYQIHLEDLDFPQQANVDAKLNVDMHFNWKTEVYCKVHHHLIIG